MDETINLEMWEEINKQAMKLKWKWNWNLWTGKNIMFYETGFYIIALVNPKIN